jgi:hypothetical protein
MKTTYSVEVERTGADRYRETFDNFDSRQQAERWARKTMESGTLMDRLLTRCTIYKNTHTSNPWRA